jgi:hypothetical protein
MLLKLTSNVSIDGIEHKAGTVIDTVKKGISSECLLTWKWAEEIDEKDIEQDADPEPKKESPAVESVVETVAEPIPEPIVESSPKVIDEPAEQPAEPVTPKPSRKSRK